MIHTPRHHLVLPPFRRARMRMLPPRDPEIGVEVRYAFDTQGGQIVMPSTWGFPDPVWDARALIRLRNDRMDRWPTFSTKMLVPVLCRSFVPKDDRPATVGLNAPYVYECSMGIYRGLLQKITGVRAKDSEEEEDTAKVTISGEPPPVEWIIEPELIYDLDVGVDFTITRTGEGIHTTFNIDFERPSPVLETDATREGLRRRLEMFDAADFMPPFNRRRYDELRKAVLEDVS